MMTSSITRTTLAQRGRSQPPKPTPALLHAIQPRAGADTANGPCPTRCRGDRLAEIGEWHNARWKPLAYYDRIPNPNSIRTGPTIRISLVHSGYGASAE
ncbi:hypothetical protein GCM10009533_54760 [Saccharopolyspora spinosporotrichia]|uniref:Uncharacterized protein n=1 Tax=Saccharopolyspora erythraea TaxID=1836 RepID=A0ABP3NMZ5_SACER